MAKDAGDVVKHLTAALSRASGDLSRAEKARKRKAETEVAAAAKKAAKKKEQDQKKMEENLKKVNTASNGEKSIFFQDVLPIFKDIPVLDENTFAQDVAKLCDSPYIVKAPNLGTIIEGNTQNILAVFAAQFPMAPQAREKGRVQSPLKVTDSQMQKIQEAMYGFAQKDKASLWPTPSKEKDKVGDIGQVQIFGFLGNMVYAGPEYNSLGTLRFTQKGERQVVLMNFSEFWPLLAPEQQQHALDAKYNLTHYLQDLLRNASSEDVFVKELLKMSVAASKDDRKFLLYKGVIPPKSILYVPAGVLVIERCLNGGHCVGLRMSLVDRSSIGQQNLNGILTIHQAYAPDATLTETWKQALSTGTGAKGN